MSDERITWHRAADTLPDSDMTVLIYAPESDPPVWLGYHDGTQWYTADAWVTTVTHWADMPVGPEGVTA